MRIRSYLALLVFSCLLGAYTLEQVLGYYFDHVQTLAEKYSKSLLWAKDLERIENSAAQFLVSTDLVVASGNTYLIYGAKNMGYYLSNELAAISTENHFKRFATEIKRSLVNVDKINDYLDIVGSIPLDQLETRLSTLLEEYDPISLTLSEDIQLLLQETNALITQEALNLETEKRFMKKIRWIARAIFFLLIVALWWWANRKICKPLNGLIYSSHRALAGDDFKATSNAPTEIIELSNDFKHLTQTLFHQASHDPLTELQNRRAFERNLNEIITDKEHNYFLCFVDLDYFKTINDTCGHAAGDEILVSVARILKSNVRAYDTVARLGGDEFAILIKNCSVEKTLQLTNTIKEHINTLTYHWEGETFKLSASIGVAPKITGSTTTDLLHSADVACSLAKNAGRNKVHLFDISQESSQEKRQVMLPVHQINNALENNLFVLFKQEITPLQNKTVGKHIEILLRMKDAQGELVKPASFFPIAARYQLCSQIDLWVVNAVCEHFMEQHEQLKCIDTIAINVSGHALIDNELALFISKKLSNNLHLAEKICFEISQASAIENLQKTCLFINNLKALGCKFALDRFVKAHTSDSYLEELSTDKIKIDGSLIRNMMENPLDYSSVKAICAMATATNQQVIATHIEDKKVVDALTKLGVDYGQGYYFAKPEPLT
ncbi:putative bifunctional diguanylate cyclase/phosphodiesterase [Pseudocolwellia agarivorans]|uniref:putative bifunctional diguanylate cyclase/phosphodiesterase n=1 Tax=Pseudocolwellia agarivorans TaxID=1911682 RepID=UPI0009878F76|nr:EAL domain-containing protein [Pseudocolwellia agarivorans]